MKTPRYWQYEDAREHPLVGAGRFRLFLGYVLAGIVNCIVIITIPFGIQSFKLAGYALWPFGQVVVHRQHRDVALGCLGNVVWFVLGGSWLALGHLMTGILFCLPVIGIPFGVASFKMAGVALAPLGKEVIGPGSAHAGAAGDHSR